MANFNASGNTTLKKTNAAITVQMIQERQASRLGVAILATTSEAASATRFHAGGLTLAWYLS